jgi:hypothetical protein
MARTPSGIIDASKTIPEFVCIIGNSAGLRHIQPLKDRRIANQGGSKMDEGRQSDFLFARLGGSRLGMRELLADAIADLTQRERLIFTLYYYEELETLEIALVLGETEFAVFQMHASALGRLKARLADPERPDAEADSDLTPHKYQP